MQVLSLLVSEFSSLELVTIVCIPNISSHVILLLKLGLCILVGVLFLIYKLSRSKGEIKLLKNGLRVKATIVSKYVQPMGNGISFKSHFDHGVDFKIIYIFHYSTEKATQVTQSVPWLYWVSHRIGQKLDIVFDSSELTFSSPVSKIYFLLKGMTIIIDVILVTSLVCMVLSVFDWV